MLLLKNNKNYDTKAKKVTKKHTKRLNSEIAIKI